MRNTVLVGLAAQVVDFDSPSRLNRVQVVPDGRHLGLEFTTEEDGICDCSFRLLSAGRLLAQVEYPRRRLPQRIVTRIANHIDEDDASLPGCQELCLNLAGVQVVDAKG